MSAPRRIAVLTTGRQDWGILRSTVVALDLDERFEPLLWVGGMHLASRFGQTADRIRQEGFTIAAELAFVSEPPRPPEDAARALTVVSEALTVAEPDCLVLVGDRSETLAAGVAATICRVPVVHLHGGEETEGAIDNVMRHALTKLSHLHLVSHERHAQRVRQMGENPDCVVVVGAPGLDNLHRPDLLDSVGLASHLGMPLPRPLVLTTVHPTTLADDVLAEVRAISSALEEFTGSLVVTLPNADQGGDRIRAYWEHWAQGRSNCRLAEALGERVYWSLLRQVDVVVGNSSSGLIEAPAAGAPVVNVGVRQRGRLREGRTWDAPNDAAAVAAAIASALAEGRQPPPGRRAAPPAASRIVEALARWCPPAPPVKRFHDLTGDGP